MASEPRPEQLPPQLPLDISPPAAPSFENFIAGRNAEALAGVRALAQGALAEPIVYLWGGPASGRSHLLQAAARANPVLVVADDVQALSAGAQQGLFVAINDARAGLTAGRAAVLAAGDAPPARLALREDLRSRLGWGLVYQLKPLSDEDKALHLRAEAARRGFALSDEVTAYLLTRLPRDLSSLNQAIERLDRHSLARQRPLTVPFVREALGLAAAPAAGTVAEPLRKPPAEA